MYNGYLSVNVLADDISQPITGATVKILNTNMTYETNENGKTGSITLSTVNKDNSLTPTNIPYVTYDIEVSKPGLTTVTIRNIEIFEGVVSIQNVTLHSNDETGITNQEIIIPPINLSGDYSGKYNEKINPVNPIVFSEVFIPEYIIVHDGIPDDNTAPKYNVLFIDYIKNVACSEIYSTWPYETLKANILAIISFTLNRVYTEWYQSKGYPFTITSVTAYDQKYSHDRTIFGTISQVVDEVIQTYIKRPEKEEPLFAQYCDGTTLQNEGWLWQWGSNDLGNSGYKSFDILKYYYGNNLEEATASFKEGLPTSFPGAPLQVGNCGEPVKKFQNQINIIRGNYPGLIEIKNPDGNFDEQTKEAVIFFQETFDLSPTGIVDYTTWYKISYLYLAVKRMIFGVYDRD